MKTNASRLLLLLILAAILAMLAACARDRTPPPTSVSVALQAAPDVNPDRNDRPSPILIRIYELRSAGIFEGSDFFSLIEQDAAVLGGDQVGRWEYQLEPGERVELDADFNSGSGFVGVVAAFRDIEHARWRAVAPIQPNQVNDFQILIDRSQVSIRLP